MPELDGIAATRRLAEVLPSTAVIVLSPARAGPAAGGPAQPLAAGPAGRRPQAAPRRTVQAREEERIRSRPGYGTTVTATLPLTMS